MSRKVHVKDDENCFIEETTEKIEHFYKDWYRFVFKENVLHVAIGMILASSFQKLVNSMVVDIITPVIIGFGVGTHTENLFLILDNGNTKNITYITVEDAKKDGAVTLNYGIFINVFVNLIFVSLCLYTLLRFVAYFRNKHINNKD